MLVWESALHVRVCPPQVLSEQLDRLIGYLGLTTVALGIVPFNAPLTLAPGDGFAIYDELLVITETWNMEQWLDGTEDITFFSRVWESLDEAAAYGRDAHRVIARARAAIRGA